MRLTTRMSASTLAASIKALCRRLLRSSAQRRVICLAVAFNLLLWPGVVLCACLSLSACNFHSKASEDSKKTRSRAVEVKPLGEPLGLVCNETDGGWVLFRKSLWRISGEGRRWEAKMQLPNIDDPLADPKFYSFYVRNYQEVWVNLGNRVLVTTDGGSSWLTAVNLSQREHINDLWFEDENVGWIVGSTYADYLDMPLVLNTSDGGKNWIQQVSLSDGNLHNPLGLELYSIYSLRRDLLWITGSGAIWSTRNGGRNWALSKVEIDGETNVRLSKIQFVDDKHGYAHYGPIKGAVPHFLVRTADGGKSWRFTKCPVIAPKLGLSDFQFFDLNNGFAIFQGLLFRTADGGEHWRQVELGGELGDIIFFLNDRQGWIAGKDGMLLHTTDSGMDWEKFQYDKNQ